jgi:hypothetical protein
MTAAVGDAEGREARHDITPLNCHSNFSPKRELPEKAALSWPLFTLALLDASLITTWCTTFSL